MFLNVHNSSLRFNFKEKFYVQVCVRAPVDARERGGESGAPLRGGQARGVRAHLEAKGKYRQASLEGLVHQVI